MRREQLHQFVDPRPRLTGAKHGGRTRRPPFAQPSPRAPLENLPSAVVPDVAAIMPDVATITNQVPPVRPHISLVVPHVSANLMGFLVVSPLKGLMELPPVLTNITPIRANVPPVLMPVDSVATKVAPVAIFAQRKH